MDEQNDFGLSKEYQPCLNYNTGGTNYVFGI